VDEEMKFKMNDRERQEKGERRILKEVKMKMKMNGRKRLAKKW
jgi:hypothetical protein